LPIAAESAVWDELLGATLGRYSDGLLRAVGERLLKPRGKKTPAELREQMAAAVANPALIDRRLKELGEPAATLLALVHASRRPRWRLGGLLELHGAIAGADAAGGMDVVFKLFASGFLYPIGSADSGKLKSFEEWLGRGHATHFEVFTHPALAQRASLLAARWPALPAELHRRAESPPRETDGLETFLRLGWLWQQVHLSPLRLTQLAAYFKRDADRLAAPPLSDPWEGQCAALPDPGMAVASLGLELGWFALNETELAAAPLRAECFTASLPDAVQTLVALLPGLASWTAWEGGQGLRAAFSPYGSVAVLSLALLRDLPEGAWAAPEDVADWIAARHPWWTGAAPTQDAAPDPGQPPARRTLALRTGMTAFLGGLAHQWKLTQVAMNGESIVVRLAPLGQAILAGGRGRHDSHAGPLARTGGENGGWGEPPIRRTRTLLVQPNLEVLAYRQGLTPGLIAELTRFADWKSLGAACTLVLGPASVYRGLESGCTFESIRQTLERHSAKELPESALAALRTWADKRDRLTVYAQATLLEFPTGADLDAYLSRNLPGARLAERLLLVASEADLDLKNFRLLGARDYVAPPGKCVSVADDGVTLTIDVPRADLLLDAELERFAIPGTTVNDAAHRVYRLTLESLRRARELGVALSFLEDWFARRTGAETPPAVRLLFSAGDLPPLAAEECLVLTTATQELADGLWQWPSTRALLERRLGPCALVVAADKLPMLRQLLSALSWPLESAKSGEPPRLSVAPLGESA
jgi:hypothetical protein